MIPNQYNRYQACKAQSDEIPGLNTTASSADMRLSPATEFLFHALQKGLEAIEASRAGLRIDEKANSTFKELVTNADTAAQKAIIKSLRENGVEVPLLGEEDDIHDFSLLDGIILDPLDGSVDFATGGSRWGILAATMKDGHAESGVLICPGQRSFVLAEHGCGTFINSEPVKLIDSPERSVAMPVGQWLTTDMQNDLRNSLNAAGIALIEMPSAVSAQIAFLRGDAGAYAGLMDRVWDSAAALAATRAAGGSTINLISQQPSNWEQQKHYPNSMSGSPAFALELADILGPLAKACSGR